MSSSIHHQIVRLPDGRRLGFVETGPRDGLLVLYLHGAIGSPQRTGHELDALTAELGVRYVMVSRPGFGDSDPLPGRTLLGFASDAAALADRLGRQRFAVVGVSAGGPYALACAHELPERVAAAALVSSMAWSSGAGRCELSLPLRAVRRTPRACARAGDGFLALARAHPGLVQRAMRSGAPRADRHNLAGSQPRELAAERFLAAARGGIGGMIDDYLLCAGDWGFELADVPVQVQLWHGVQDELVTVDAALHMAAGLPRAQTGLDPDEGHFFYERRLRVILGDLVRAAAGQAPPAGVALRSPGSPAGSGSR